MTPFERAIHSYCGLVIEGIPADGKMRRFRIGSQEGFAIFFGDCGSFGNWNRNEMFAWDGKKAWKIEPYQAPRKLSGKALQAEQQIVDIGVTMAECGIRKTEEDNDRYILALQRVMEAARVQG